MKLNKSNRDQLRQEVELLLQDVPAGKRIHIDKDILETLLFEVRTYTVLPKEKSRYSGRQVSVKYLIWSGKFLQKIDLSEVSFEDVVWDVHFSPHIHFYGNPKNVYSDCSVDLINLSNTNAKIDFSLAADFKYYGRLCIGNCNFSSVDLSQTKLAGICSAKQSVFDNTNIQIDFSGENQIAICNSSFYGVDLSTQVVDEGNFVRDARPSFIDSCNLSRTGLKIDTFRPSREDIAKFQVYKELRSTIRGDLPRAVENLADSLQPYLIYRRGMKEIAQLVKMGYLEGCFINGVEMVSLEERKENAKKLLLKYTDYKDDLFISLTVDIKNQIHGFSKK